MNRRFFPKLALINIRKNAKTYVPYLLTCIGTIMMFYNMYNMALDQGFEKMVGGPDIIMIMRLGTTVIGIFSCIFLFYTYSFLIKRRKKEFGLFNILGMEKKHISKTMAYETFYIFFFSLSAGILGGILLSKLLHLILLKMLRFPVKLGFHIDIRAIFGTFVLFGIIFLATYLNTLGQIHLAKPVELLSGGQVGEKEPKVKWLLAVLGFVCLAFGYYIAIVTESPLEALLWFFAAVIAVIMGTYFLFTAGSIAFLKLLRKNKKYYYQTRHFTAVSGMLYRMKQNAVGLANICILSTMVLIMVSGTIALYFGMEDSIRNRFPRNVIVHGYGMSVEEMDKISQDVEALLEKKEIEQKNTIRYGYRTFELKGKDGRYEDSTDGYFTSQDIILTCIFLEDYNRVEGQKETLQEGECLLYEEWGLIKEEVLELGSAKLTIKKRLNGLPFFTDAADQLMQNFYLVLPDEKGIQEVTQGLTKEEKEGFSYYYGFDADIESKAMLSITEKISKKIDKNNVAGRVECIEQMRNDFNVIYGGMLFLGLFLGILFMMAMVLIIYYKQITEGYDDKERFRIMQNVGMSHSEVKRSIKSQVVTVFFLPLATAGIHVAFAFKMITKLLALLNLTNVTLFALCVVGTLLVFTVFYGIVYVLTARVYYRIVAK